MAAADVCVSTQYDVWILSWWNRVSVSLMIQTEQPHTPSQIFVVPTADLVVCPIIAKIRKVVKLLCSVHAPFTSTRKSSCVLSSLRQLKWLKKVLVIVG